MSHRFPLVNQANLTRYRSTLNITYEQIAEIMKVINRVQYNGAHWSNDVQSAMEELDTICSFSYGVESLYPDYPTVFYLNTGETYDLTIIFDYDTERFYLASWGDYYEYCESHK